ncbi:LCP family protein [Corynebacterium mendelii]|uniref:LCP family protein n=1 Tax=Corynebacterium mendelii TaxID=2765362 RepID=A0A939E445_9CORY|nr:LCP family protein [Corynebacterium mendelii]MBN9645316.1 LCP family protein [Corynebacterium mendelii]
MDSRGPDGGSNQHAGSDDPDIWARDRHGQIIYDRFGRPVRKRSATVNRPSPETTGPTDQTRILDSRRAGPPRPAQPSPGMPHRGNQPYPPGYRQHQQPPGYPPAGQNPGAYPPAYRQAPVPPPVPSAPPTGSARPTRRRRPRRRRGCGCGCFSGIVLPLVVIVALIVAGMLYVDARLPRVAATPPQRIASTSGTNWLLVGSDSRQGLTAEQEQQLGTGGDLGSSRTDTIMLAHIPLRGQPTLLSIPRDSYVDIPGYGMNKINASFAFGGPQLLVQTVEGATGLHIDHYAEVGFGGFAGIVDAIGGVEMCLDQPIADPLAHIDLPAGCQKLGGPDALGYVRSRAFPRGDLDRVEHQREFFSALLDTATSPATLLNPFRFFPLIKRGMMSLTIGADDHVWNLARLVWAVRGGVATETVPIADMGMTDVGSVVYWDNEQAGALFAGLGSR